MENNNFILKGFVKSYSGNQMNINEEKAIVKKSYKLLVVEGIYKTLWELGFRYNFIEFKL